MGQKVEIRCKQTRRLLTKIDEKGLYLFCRQDKEEHILTIQDLAKIIELLAQGTEDPVYTI